MRSEKEKHEGRVLTAINALLIVSAFEQTVLRRRLD